MFRFTIRDLLWLTLVVALALGWWMDRKNLDAGRGSLRTDLERAMAWRTRAGALEEALKNERCGVRWELQSSKVYILRGYSEAATSQMVLLVYPTDSHEPSASDE